MLVDGRHYVRVKVARKRGRELNSFHSRSGHCPQEAAEGGSTFVLFKAGQGFRPIAIHILSDQMNLAITVIPKLLNLRDDVGCFAALFPAA